MIKCEECKEEIHTWDIAVNDLEGHIYHRNCWHKRDLPVVADILNDQTILNMELVVSKQVDLKKLKNEIGNAVQSVLDQHYDTQWKHFWWYQITKEKQ